MQNQSLRPGFSGGVGISCEGKTYTFPLKTLADGSAVKLSITNGFCANETETKNKKINKLTVLISLDCKLIIVV